MQQVKVTISELDMVLWTDYLYDFNKLEASYVHLLWPQRSKNSEDEEDEEIVVRTQSYLRKTPKFQSRTLFSDERQGSSINKLTFSDSN